MAKLSSAQHPVLGALSWHSCFSRREVERQWGHCSPGFCVLRIGLAHAELASSIRPGERTGLRRVTSLASGSRSSVATATTVPARVGVLTVPKLGPPAQDLIGAVLPTATRHAGGRVINVKLKCLPEELIGAMIVFKNS